MKNKLLLFVVFALVALTPLSAKADETTTSTPTPVPTSTPIPAPSFDYDTLPTYEQLEYLIEITSCIDLGLSDANEYNAQIADSISSVATSEQISSLIEETTALNTVLTTELQAVYKQNEKLTELFAEKIDYLTIHIVFIAGFIACSWCYQYIKRIFERKQKTVVVERKK